jgi:hypothetical protein
MATPTIKIDKEKSFATHLRESVMRAKASETEPDSLYSRLRQKLDRVKIDGVDLYVAEGDTLLDEDQLWLYSLEREESDRAAKNRNFAKLGGMGTARLLQPPSQPSGLLGIVDENGRFVRWPENMVLTYCVLKQTFVGPDRDDHYQLVVERMKEATADWEATCDVRFEHKQALDSFDGVRPDGVVFPVRELDTNGRFIAASFFPNDPLDRRRLVIDPSFYPAALRFSKRGVLRHELGHVLGFRHEHIRGGAPPECPKESTAGTFPFTDYDPKSVMHYFCGGVGSAELAITPLDQVGAVKLYGAPAAGLSGLVGGEDPAELLAPVPAAFVS